MHPAEKVGSQPGAASTGQPMNIVHLSQLQCRAYAAQLANLLIDCVRDGTSVGFLASLGEEEALAYWRSVEDAMRSGSRLLLVGLDDAGLVGTVQLELCLKPNGVNRAEVQKLLVHTSARRRGIAARLMAAAEDLARSRQRGLVYLDTEAGSPAEAFYRAQGYACIGGLPDYACSPDGEWRANAIYYKTLFTRGAE
jgi:acetyltransferase